MDSSQTTAVVVLRHAVDYPSWRIKDFSNTNLLVVLAILNHVWKMCMFCTNICSLNEFSDHIQSFDI